MKYLLIGLVVCIWGVIIYKVVRGLAGEDPPPPVTKIKPPRMEDSLTGYHLTTALYPDPFGNDIFEGDTITEVVDDVKGGVAGKSGPAGIAANPAPVPVPMTAPPPSIKYSGYIYNPQTKKKIAMISVNGRGMTVSVNEKIDEKIKVLDISDQKITVSVDGKRMVVALGG